MADAWREQLTREASAIFCLVVMPPPPLHRCLKNAPAHSGGHQRCRARWEKKKGNVRELDGGSIVSVLSRVAATRNAARRASAAHNIEISKRLTLAQNPFVFIISFAHLLESSSSSSRRRQMQTSGQRIGPPSLSRALSVVLSSGEGQMIESSDRAMAALPALAGTHEGVSARMPGLEIDLFAAHRARAQTSARELAIGRALGLISDAPSLVRPVLSQARTAGSLLGLSRRLKPLAYRWSRQRGHDTFSRSDRVRSRSDCGACAHWLQVKKLKNVRG